MAQDRTLTLGPVVAAPAAATRLGLPLLVTLLAVVIGLAKIQEVLLPPLQAVRPALVSLSAALALTLLLGSATGRRLRVGKEVVLYVGLTLLAAATVPLSVWPGGALTTVVYTLVPQVLLLVAVRANVGSERAFRWVVRTLVLSMMLLALGAALAPRLEGDRVSTGMTYDANDLGLIFVCCLPLALPDLVKGRLLGRIFAAAAMAAGTVGILRTGSRGALVGLAAAAIYLAIRRTEHLPRWLKFLGLAAAVAVLAGPFTRIFAERLQAILEGHDYNFTVGRLAIWANAAEIAVQRPLGIGAGQFGAALGLYTGGRDWHTAHNSFLQVLVELGVVGAVLFVLFLYRAWRDAGRVAAAAGVSTKSRLEAQCTRAALVGYLASGMFLSQAYLMAIPVIVGAIAGLREAAEGGEPEAGTREVRASSQRTVSRGLRWRARDTHVKTARR